MKISEKAYINIKEHYLSIGYCIIFSIKKLNITVYKYRENKIGNLGSKYIGEAYANLMNLDNHTLHLER